MEYYNYLKSLHLIFVITWFAGLFYIVRLFVYHIEAGAKPQPERNILQKQFKIMSYRLWYFITLPSSMLASFFAFWMLFFTDLGMSWIKTPWMGVKLVFVLLLYIYQWKCQIIFGQLQRNIVKHTPNFMRLWNEVPTVILFAVVFLAVLKTTFHWIYGVVGIISLSILIMIGVRVYRKRRTRNKQ